VDPIRPPSLRSGPVIEDNAFVANEAWEGGGARLCFFQGSLTEPVVRRNTFLDNEAMDYGGGLGIYSADPVVTSCTFDGNYAGIVGGGVYVKACEEAPNLGQTIVSNSASGGGIAVVDALLTTELCDVWGNADGDYVGCSPASDDISADPLFCEPDANNVTLRDDSPCLPENNVAGVLIGACGAGDCGLGIDGEVSDLFFLTQPFPNPARGSIRLGFFLARPATVELMIVGVNGRVVRRLEASPGVAGEHSLVWDGRDSEGHRVASGVYLVRGTAGVTLRGITSYRAVVLLD
jgi:hypothetical protein